MCVCIMTQAYTSMSIPTHVHIHDPLPMREDLTQKEGPSLGVHPYTCLNVSIRVIPTYMHIHAYPLMSTHTYTNTHT
jgi:hypothetical protein